MDREIKVYARFDMLNNTIDMFVRSKEDGILRIAPSLLPETFSPAEPGKTQSPTLTIAPECGQELMDQLWSCGLRPKAGSGSAGSLAATENHLKDLRKITFNLLKIEN
jgi:hypothetical protein